MGAQTFCTFANGTTPQEAFYAATRRARWEHGHGGYTGTIAEKSDFKMIPIPDTFKPGLDGPHRGHAWASEIMLDDDHWVQDKWGPAGCIKLDKGLYLFFGCASS